MHNSQPKTALVTGATQGIGLAICERLHDLGYHVLGIARREPASSFPATFYRCDLADRDDTAQVLHTIKKHHKVDIIVHNAGITLPQPLGEIDLQTFYQVYDLNVRAAIQVTQALIDEMKVESWGRIINISSRAIYGAKSRSSYSAAKSALIGLTRTWALELAQHSITVNAIAPGAVETALFRQAHPVGSEAEKTKLASIPLGRLGKPCEIAAAVAFLVSEDAAFITGQTLDINGGEHT